MVPGMLETLQPPFGSWFRHWLGRRLPPARSITLSQRQIFIVPSKTAFALFAIILVLLLLGINFQNSLVYVVCFWLLALLLVNILHTWRNLSNLTLTALPIQPCFAGEKAVLELELACPAGQQKFAIELLWSGEDAVQTDLLTAQTRRVKLSHSTQARGYFQPPRIRVATRFPTGLALAWSYFTPDLRGVVYPEPAHKAAADHSQPQAPADVAGGREKGGGSNDFAGIRPYRAGDTPRRIHWGKYAQTGTLYTKEFIDHTSHELWLDWDSLPALGMEARLAQLCRRVLDAAAAQHPYGLKLPGTAIPPGKGEAHQAHCLRALALYGLEDKPDV